MIESSKKASSINPAEPGGNVSAVEKNEDAGSAFTQMLSQGMHTNVFSSLQAPQQSNGNQNSRQQEHMRPSNISNPPEGMQNIRHNPNIPPPAVNPLLVFETLIRTQHPPNAPRDLINPHEVMSQLPREIQMLVENVEPYVSFWREPDCRTIIGGTLIFVTSRYLTEIAPQY
jgi:hypothetical protein